MSALLSQILGKFRAALQNPACPGCQKPMPNNVPGSGKIESTPFCDICMGKYNFRESFPLVQAGQQSSIYAATLFNATLKRIIYGYKFYRQEHHQTLLTALLTTYWENVVENGPPEFKACDPKGDNLLGNARQVLVAPVPAHEGHRGHLNPIAEAFARHFGYRYEPDILRWQRAVSPQHTLTRRKRRYANVQGGMSVLYGSDPKPLLGGKRVIIIDDIHTTGATLYEATQAFQRCPVYDGAVTGLAISHLALAFQRPAN